MLWGATTSMVRPLSAPVAPLLAALAASKYLDRRESSAAARAAPPLALSSSSGPPDCLSSTALLVVRGFGAGLAWTVGVDAYTLLSIPDAVWAERMAAKGATTSQVREMGRTLAWLGARNMVGFASFLGIFGGVSCSMEVLRGRNDLLNPFVGGFTAGLALLPGELRTPRAILASAALCGVASMSFHFFIPTSEDKLPRLLTSPSAGATSGMANATPIPIPGDVQWAVNVQPIPPRTCRNGSVNEREVAPATPAAKHAAAATADTPAMREFTQLLRDRYDGKRSLRLAFLNWDRNKDGMLSTTEVREMILSLGFGKRLGEHKIDDIIDHIASLPCSSMKYDDFCTYIFGNQNTAGVSDHPTSTESAMAAATKQLDWQTAVGDQSLYPDRDAVINILRKKYESRKLHKIFRHWDTNKDGWIDLEELDMNLRRQGVRLSATQLQDVFAHYDKDQDGRLLYSDFVQMIYGPIQSDHCNPALQAHRLEATKAKSQDPYRILRNPALEASTGRINEDEIRFAVQQKLKAFAPRLNDAYASFDNDHSGLLSYAEFRDGLKQLGLHFTEKEFFHLANTVDTDGSGEICFREFSNLFYRQVARGTPTPEPEEPDPHMYIIESYASRIKDTFDFTHLSRRIQLPTRRGNVPPNHTKEVICTIGPDDGAATRFQTESQLYGGGVRVRHPAKQHHDGLTIGQEERRRKQAHYGQRLDRLRVEQTDFDTRHVALSGTYDAKQERRNRTVHKQQVRYNSSIEMQRLHQPVHEHGRRPQTNAPAAVVPPYYTGCRAMAIMREVFEAFLTDPVRINEDIYALWLEGHNATDALEIRMRTHMEIPVLGDQERIRELLWRDTVDQYRLYEKLEHYLMHPALFRSQLLFQIPPIQQHYMVERYYTIDGHVGRWLMGRKLTSKLQKDLDEISDQADCTLQCCRRQLDNLQRIHSMLEDRNFQGLLCSVISESLRISEKLASKFTCLIFLIHARFDVHPTHRTTGFLTWDDLLFFAAVMMTHWLPQRKPLQQLARAKSASATPATPAPTSTHKTLQQLPSVVDNAATIGLRVENEWPTLGFLQERLQPLSVRATVGIDLGPKMTNSLRDLKAHLINDSEMLAVYRKYIMEEMLETYSAKELKELKVKLYLVVHGLLTIGAGLSQPKEFKDFLENLFTMVVRVLKDCRVRGPQLNSLFSALIDSLARLDVWYLTVDETRGMVLASWERFLSVCRIIVVSVYDRVV
ncbi:TPA: hypothetical protein N0F65_012116 [Lagenidium giganteum]|uniref:EF-hand domain-containing protein n=1 Tax=Lagenidium giganteum TaxID=4803 RepID=A0AAV2YUC9_9STRA|nr:TPA: hypothetical protein N0F65_012116 [Lagenidium giganteum]